MFGMGGGELVVLALVGLFVLGPERLPAAIRWVSAAVGQAKGYLETAKEQMNAPEFDSVRKPLEELRAPLSELRSLDPRRSVARALREPAPSRDPRSESVPSPAAASPPAATDVPTTDVPTPDIPTPDIPTVDVPTPDVPTVDVPTTDVPTVDVPTPRAG